MEAIGSEVGQKMRSAIKAKLMELGCYVDDELPDYVMVMVANKRTRAQMEDDLQLFLTNNTEAFVGWLHQVLQKLQEVTINKKLLTPGEKKTKSKAVDVKKERKEKKKDKQKSKDKEKPKSKDKHSKKDKSKDKKHSSDEVESIRPNVPPLYMNLAKESSPSITDVFAGQILKSHGIKLSTLEKDSAVKVITDGDTRLKKKLTRNKFPIIDPNTVSQISDKEQSTSSGRSNVNDFDVPSLSEVQKERDKLAALPREEQIKEFNEINAKIQSLKKKLAEQLESGSEDEDFINLRTEAEEIIGVDLNEEIVLDPVVKTPPAPIIAATKRSSDAPISSNKTSFRRISSPEIRDSFVKTPPARNVGSDFLNDDDSQESLTPVKKVQRTPIRAPSPDKPPELPVIELNLPKRSMRDRLGMKSSGGFGDSVVNRTVNKVNPYQSSIGKSNEDFIHDRMRSEKLSRSQNDKLDVRNKINRDGDRSRKETEKDNDFTNKRRIGSRVVPLPPAPEEDNLMNNISVASVVRAPPRPPGPAGAPASQLLLRAMADAQKSLLTMPPKNNETKKRATVLPMRRNTDSMKKIIIQVPSENIPVSNSRDDNRDDSDYEIDMDTESLGDLESDGDIRKDSNMEYVPEPLGRTVSNTSRVDYVPTHIDCTEIEMPVISRVLHLKNEKTSQMRRDPQFVVTLEGVDPNMFLEKKLCKEIEEEEKQASGSRDKDANITDNRLSNKDDAVKDESNTNNNETMSESEHKENVSNPENFPSKVDKSNVSKEGKSQSHVEIQPKQINIKQSSTERDKRSVTECDISSSDNNIASDNNEGNATKTRKSIMKITFDNDQRRERDKSAMKKIVSPNKSDASSRTDDGSKVTKRKSDADSDKPMKQRKCLSPIVFDKVEESHTSSKYSILPPLSDKKVKKTSITRDTRCKFFPDCALGPACEFYHPPLSTSPSAACRAFPNCPYGDKCAYGHPPCKFDVLCTRTGCPYSHVNPHKTNKLVNQSSVAPAIASRVVPVQNYKTISATPLPAICKFYPNCTNPACHFFHPKLCRFGKACLNKIECNFYHHDVPCMNYYT